MSEELIPYLGGLISLVSSFFGAFASGGSVLILLGALFVITPYPYITLLATAKVAGAAMVLVSACVHYKRTRINLGMIAVMTMGGLIGMVVATYLLQIITNEKIFEWTLGALLIVFGIYFLFSKQLGLESSERKSFTKKELFEVFCLKIFVGFINGFSGGMGMILNSYLVLRLKMSFIEASAYTMISGLLVVSVQAIYLLTIAEIHLALLIMVLVGSLLGGFVGTQMQYLKGNRTVKWVVTGMMLILGGAAFF